MNNLSIRANGSLLVGTGKALNLLPVGTRIYNHGNQCNQDHLGDILQTDVLEVEG